MDAAATDILVGAVGIAVGLLIPLGWGLLRPKLDPLQRLERKLAREKLLGDGAYKKAQTLRKWWLRAEKERRLLEQELANCYRVRIDRLGVVTTEPLDEWLDRYLARVADDLKVARQAQILSSER